MSVENASYRYGFVTLLYALLVDVMVRGIVRREGAWDLLAMVVLGSAVCTFYQARRKVLVRGTWTKALIVAGIAGILSAIIAVVLVATQGR